MATVYFPDGRTKQVEPANGRDFQLEEIKSALEFGPTDYIEIVWLHSTKHLLVIDEEGKLKDLQGNVAATALWYGSEGIQNDFIVGPALYCKFSEIE